MERIETRLAQGWDTALSGLWACAAALGDRRSREEVATASGLAFRISVDHRVTSAGMHGFAWREGLTVAAERLGYRWRLVASEADEPLWRSSQAEAFDLIRQGVDAGRPTLLFGVQVAEFGLAVGYDEEAVLISGVLDGDAPDSMARGALGEANGILFALQLVERREVDPKRAAQAVLRAAGAAHQGREAVVGDCAAGAAAWRQMGQALASGEVDPTGLAYTVQRLAEARAAVAQTLPGVLAVAELEPGGSVPAARRCSTMLLELARLLPFPPPATEPLTTTRREQAAELVAEAAAAAAEMVAAIAQAFVAEKRASRPRLVELTRDRLTDLFACVREIPIAGLEREAADCRQRADFSGRLLYRGDRAIGHILWAPLEWAHYPVTAQGYRWLVFCPWLEEPERGRGLGGLLFDAVEQAARAAGVDGLLTLATSIDVFLHHRSYEHYGFVEVDRRGDTRLLERRLNELPSRAQLVDPPVATPGRALPVLVRHGYNCPLLLRVRRDAATAGRGLGARAAVDEADASPGQAAGVAIGGRAVAHGPIPRGALSQGLAREADDWNREC